MLTKSCFINLNKIVPTTAEQAVELQEVLKSIVAHYLYKHITDKAFSHLNVMYHYTEHSISSYMYIETKTFDYSEIAYISNIVSSTINTTIEEYNVYNIYNKNTALNFNSCLLNKNTFVLISEVLKKE